MGVTFWLLMGLPPVVCKSIAKASKVRILHPPPRAERAPDLRKRRLGAFSCTWRGYRKRPCLGDLQCRGSRVCGLRKRVWRTAGVELRTEYARKFQSRQRASRGLAGLARACPAPMPEGGGMQWLQTYKLSRLSSFVATAFCGGRDQARLQRRTVER